MNIIESVANFADSDFGSLALVVLVLTAIFVFVVGLSSI